MESLQITRKGDKFHVDGFPAAVKLIKVDGPKAQRLADLALHRTDLKFALACLKEINSVPSENAVQREALWRAAIVHYMKCFGSSDSRFSLVADQIHKGDQGGLTAFEYFKSLRNRHLVHDANSYAQALVGAVLNAQGQQHKIAKVVVSSFIAVTLGQDDWGNLHKLVTVALAWVTDQADRLCNILTAELERTAYDELAQRDDVTYRAPDVSDITLSR